jgi:hypothetical protein
MSEKRTPENIAQMNQTTKKPIPSVSREWAEVAKRGPVNALQLGASRFAFLAINKL